MARRAKKSAKTKRKKKCPKCNAFCNGSQNLCDLFAQGNRFQGYHRPSGWPMASTSMAVPIKSFKKAIELDKERGAPPTEYKVSKYRAQPIFTSERHKTAYAKAHGMHDMNGVMG